MFNNDLSNATFEAGVWSINSDGVISATKDSALWSEKEYENFEVRCNFMVDNGTNSGVIVYASEKAFWIPNSVEIQIKDDEKAIAEGAAPTVENCGAFFGHVAPAKLVVKKPGEWNSMSVKCKGQNIEVTLNGEKMCSMDMSKWTSAKQNPDGSNIFPWLSKAKASMATKGFIGFQGKHGKSNIYFKNIEIRPIQ